MTTRKGPPPLHRELHRWYDRRLGGCWVAVDADGGVYAWDTEAQAWLEDYESYSDEALQRVCRLLAEERGT